MSADLTLEQISSDVTWPDREVAQQARDHWASLDKPAGSLGRLEDLGVWWAAARASSPPPPPTHPALVIFAADHGIARTAGTSAYPPEHTAQMARSIAAGTAASRAIAQTSGVRVRLVDVSVDADPHFLDDLDATATAQRVRRSTGSIDREDAMSAEETQRAFEVGVAVADAEVDGGADLLALGDIGVGNTTVATAIIGLYAPSDVVPIVGRGSGIDDATWMRKCAAVRDGMRRGRELKGEPMALLSAIGGPDIAAMVGFLLRAAARRTPVILDGLAPSAAALIAHRSAFRAREWWQAGHLSTEPAHGAALQRLDLEPLLNLRMNLGEGTGALLAIPLVTAAASTMNDMVVAGAAPADSASTTVEP